MNANKIYLIDPIIPDGQYTGTWNGYCIKFSINHQLYELGD